MNHPGLALIRRPGAVVVLDDDLSYLEMLATVLPKTWDVRLYQHPSHCIEAVLGNLALWEADLQAQQRMLERASEGDRLIPLLLDYWSHDLDRYQLIQACVLDYSMPGMDGVATLKAMDPWQGGRIMLTGQADEHLAVSAFNQGLISQFIPKQSPNILNRLITSIQQVLNSPSAPLTQQWRKSLTSEQYRVLRQPGVSADLSALSHQLWVEHVILGSPFGMLGMSASGKASWLQLETMETLRDLSELAATLGISALDCAKIESGLMLAGVELHQSLDRSGQVACMNAQRLGDKGDVVAALFEIESTPYVEEARSYTHWLSRFAQPRLQG